MSQWQWFSVFMRRWPTLMYVPLLYRWAWQIPVQLRGKKLIEAARVAVLQCTMHVTHEDGAMSDATFTFRVDDGLKAEFANAAKAHDRTGAQLLRDFMRSYVAQQEETQQYDAWLAKKVELSRASAEAGNLIPAADVEARFAARRAATRARMAADE